MKISITIGGKEYSLDAILRVLLAFVEQDESRLVPLLDKAEHKLDQE